MFTIALEEKEMVTCFNMLGSCSVNLQVLRDAVQDKAFSESVEKELHVINDICFKIKNSLETGNSMGYVPFAKGKGVPAHDG